jgi:NAD(P)H dehydrogenase (quinone)
MIFLVSDGIIAGSPVYFGTMAAEMKAIFEKFVGIRKHMEDKIGPTSADPSGGKETTIMSIIQAIRISIMLSFAVWFNSVKRGFFVRTNRHS